MSADRRRDLVVAGCSWLCGVVLVVAVAVVAATQPGAIPDAPQWGSGGSWVGLALVTAQGLVLLRRRAQPRSTLVAVAAAVPVAALADVGAATGATSVAVIVAAYSLVVTTRFARAAPALAAATGLAALAELVTQTQADAAWGVAIASALLQGLGTLAVPTAAGTVVRSLNETRTARDERSLAVAREQAALVQVAVARERTAMARELHDIAAHHLSGIAVMTGAIGRQIDVDPEGAKAAVQQVREQSTAMLRDMRSLVGLLREEPTEVAPSAGRQESLSGITALVDAARTTGADVRLTVIGRADGRPPGVEVGPLAQLAAYRTVQEALANAARHSPGAHCEVVVDARDPAEVLVTVSNGAPREGPGPALPVSGGFGLVGMRERAELTDARLEAGPTADGGWRVSLSLPTQDDAGRTAREAVQ
jgi:signal transduction histidine kinase